MSCLRCRRITANLKTPSLGSVGAIKTAALGVRPGVQGVWRVTLNLYLDFSSAVIVTCDTEHFLFRMLGRWRSLTLILEKINIRSLKASWEATPDVSDSARTTTNKGMSKTVQARTISPDFNVNNHCKMSKFSKEIFIRRSWPRKH
jgi:hypothetical protein